MEPLSVLLHRNNARALWTIDYMKTTIRTKILFGYVPVFLVTIIITLLTLTRFNEVDHLNSEIINQDLVLNRAAEGLTETLLGQENYGRRYMILNSPDMLSLFRGRDKEFKESLAEIRTLSTPGLNDTIDLLTFLHHSYDSLFFAGVTHRDSSRESALLVADSLRSDEFDKQISVLKNLVALAEINQTQKTQHVADIGRSTFRTVMIIAILGVVLSIGVASLITTGTVRSIRTLQQATNQVSQGNFRDLPSVQSRDELGELSVAFNEMANRLIQLEEIYMDSSPLTRLPGGIAVENAVKMKINRKEPFAFCMMDLDNFKPFNDRYGYSRGNDVIRKTAEILKDCSRDYGEDWDFVGHIGGDDFAYLTSPEKFRTACERIIESFDREISAFYDPEDLQAGHIISKSRQGETLKFPVMTISISALDSEKSYVENHIQVGEIMAELKKYAKKSSKSNLVIDRRGGRAKKSAA